MKHANMSTTRLHLYLLQFRVHDSQLNYIWNQVCLRYALDENDAQLKVAEEKAGIIASSKVSEDDIQFEGLQAVPGGFQLMSSFYPGTIVVDEHGHIVP